MAKIHKIEITVRENWFELKTLWNAYVESEGKVEWYLEDEVDDYFEKRVHGFWMRANAGTLKHYNNQVKSEIPEEIPLPDAKECWSYTLTNMMHRRETARDKKKLVISNVIDAIFISGIIKAREKFGPRVSFSKAMTFVMHSFDTKVIDLGYKHYAKEYLERANAKTRKKISSGDAVVGDGDGRVTLFDQLTAGLLEEFSEVEQKELFALGEEVGREYAESLLKHPSRMVGLVLYMSRVSVKNKPIAELIKMVVGVAAGTIADHWAKDRKALGEVVEAKYGAEFEDDAEARNYVTVIAMDVAFEIGKKWFFSENQYEDLFPLLER